MTSDIVPTDPHKMHRTDDPETSVDRAYDLDTESQKVVLISVFVVVGVNGMTTSEVAQAIGKDRATFSSTITQLRREDLLFYSGIRRDKQNVWVSTKYRTDWALTATPNMFQAMNEQREKDQEGAIKDRKLRALEEENHRLLENLNCQDAEIDELKAEKTRLQALVDSMEAHGAHQEKTLHELREFLTGMKEHMQTEGFDEAAGLISSFLVDKQ